MISNDDTHTPTPPAGAPAQPSPTHPAAPPPPAVADLEAQQKPLDPYAPQDTATYGDQAPAQTYAYPTTLAPAQQVV